MTMQRGALSRDIVPQTSEYPNNGIASGEVSGSTSAVQLPNIPCFLANIKAVASNAGNIYIGGKSSVTKVDETTDTTTGIELSAGQETGWIPISNLNKLYYICDNAGDDLTYMVIN